MFFHKNEHQLEKSNHEKVVSHLQTEYSQKDINAKELHEKVVGHLQTKYDKKVMNTKKCHENVVGHIHTKYDENVKHNEKVVNKLNTDHSHKKMNTM